MHVLLAIVILVCTPSSVHAAGTTPLTFGLPGYKVDAASQGDRISVYATKVPVRWLVDGLRKHFDGPVLSAPQDFNPFVTIAVHGLTWTDLFQRILSHHNVMFSYRGRKLVRVRLLGPIPSQRTTAGNVRESREHWFAVEGSEMNAE